MIKNIKNLIKLKIIFFFKCFLTLSIITFIFLLLYYFILIIYNYT